MYNKYKKEKGNQPKIISILECHTLVPYFALHCLPLNSLQE